MMSQLPINYGKVSKPDQDQDMMRAGMIAELDAVSFYNQMAADAGNSKVKKLLLDVAKEEKTHIGEFEAMLLKLDAEQKQETAAGAKEVEEKFL